MTTTQNTYPTMAELFNTIEQEVLDNDALKKVLADTEVKMYANKLHKLLGSEEKARTKLNAMLIASGKLKDKEKISTVKFKSLLDKVVKKRTGKS